MSLTTVTVSSKFQVVIPEEVRDKLRLRSGQKVVVIEKDGVVHMIPVRPIKQTRGLAKGAKSKGFREEHERL
jgi:AbrB family looped-hinge helix DNA binding protein